MQVLNAELYVQSQYNPPITLGMQTVPPIVPFEALVIERIRQLLDNRCFQQRHRRGEKDFTRRRELTSAT